MQAREISKAIYTEFLQRHSLDNVWQTTMMGDMQEARGRHVLYLGIFDDTDTLTGATNVVLEPSHFGALHAGSPRGPILDYTGSQVTASLQAVRDFLKQKHVMYWTLNPYAVYEKHTLDGKAVQGSRCQGMYDQLMAAGARHRGFVHGIDNSTEPRWMYVIPTDFDSPQAMLDSFAHKCSRSIRRAMDFGVRVRELSEQELSLIDEMFVHAGDKHEFSWRNDDYTCSRSIRRAMDFGVRVRELSEQELSLIDEMFVHAGDKHEFSWRNDDYTRRLWNAFHESGAVKFLVAEITLQDYTGRLQKTLETLRQQQAETEDSIARIRSKKMLNRLKEIEQKTASVQKHLEEAETFEADGPVLKLAAGIFFDYGQEVICLMSGYDERYAWFCGPYAMHWQMLKHCLEQGYARYNLYGISGEFRDMRDTTCMAFPVNLGMMPSTAVSTPSRKDSTEKSGNFPEILKSPWTPSDTACSGWQGNSKAFDTGHHDITAKRAGSHTRLFSCFWIPLLQITSCCPLRLPVQPGLSSYGSRSCKSRLAALFVFLCSKGFLHRFLLPRQLRQAGVPEQAERQHHNCEHDADTHGRRPDKNTQQEPDDLDQHVNDSGPRREQKQGAQHRLAVVPVDGAGQGNV